MKIETKLEVGDIGYFMKNNIVHSDEIEKINIAIVAVGGLYNSHIRVIINYTTLNKFNYVEDDIFATKQLLLDTL